MSLKRQKRQKRQKRNKLKLPAQLDTLHKLFQIISDGNLKEFTEILQKETNLKRMLNFFVRGQTALHFSLLNGRDITWCKQLVMKGANPNLTNLAGWHPIHLAAYNSTVETLDYLIQIVQ